MIVIKGLNSCGWTFFCVCMFLIVIVNNRKEDLWRFNRNDTLVNDSIFVLFFTCVI